MTIDVPARGDRIEGEPPARKPVGRRTVLAGAAWAVPAIAVATAAPAHAASGLILKFDKTSYSAVGCGTLSGVSLTVSNGGVPVAATGVSVVLPTGFSFATGGTSISGYTDGDGMYAVPDINVPNSQSTAVLTAVAGTLNASASVRVGANSSIALAENGVVTANWTAVPAGSVAIGANYFLSPTNQLWFENTLVVPEVQMAVGWGYGGEQYADYVLPNGKIQRAKWGSPHYDYPSLPADARPIGQADFLTDASVLYHYDIRVTGNVKSIVVWSDGNHHADVELTSGVLIGLTQEYITSTRSPLPASAKPIGADYFLSDDGDLFFRTEFVATQVTSATGWFYNGGAFHADYMTEYGQAFRARDTNPREGTYPGTPAGARALGTEYYLTDDGRLFWGGQFAIDNVDKAIAWSVGTQMIADVRTTSGASIRLFDRYIDQQWSAHPENALSIGASYYFDADRQELYYKGKLLVTGVTSAAGWHRPGAGDFCDFSTVRGESIRAFYDNNREWVHQNIPAGATALGSTYFLKDGVLYYADMGPVAHGVTRAITWQNGTHSADIQLASGAIAQMNDGAIAKTYSPMPQDAAPVGADYFLTPGGELYWQGRLIATDVASAVGYYFRGWGQQMCDYVTGDGVAVRAGNERPADAKYTAVKYAKPLSRGYFLTDGGDLYWYDRPVRFGDNTPVRYDLIAPWSDQSYMHADLRTPDGKYHRLIESGVQHQYWANVAAPQDAVPVGIYHYLTPTGDLFYCGSDNVYTVIATGVTEATGWFDTTRWVACVDYRDSNGVVRRADNGTSVATYTGVAGGAKLLGSGYFRDTANDVWFADRDTQVLTKVAMNPGSFDAWTDPDGFYLTYRPAAGNPLRVKGASTGSPQVWAAGATPLGAELIGAKYALAANGVLWYAGVSVRTGVTDAVGWSQPAGGHFYADYRSSDGVTRIDGESKELLAYAPLSSGAELLGYGYQLDGSQLLYRGREMRDAQGNLLATNVASGFTWVDGGDRPFCDYRTLDLGSFRIQRTNTDQLAATETVGDGDLQNWTPNRATPVGSEPRGADYFLSADGVLTFQGQLVDSSVSEAAGWNWGGDRYADYRVLPTGKRVQARGTDKTPSAAYQYTSQAIGTSPIGAGHWLNATSGEVWFRDSTVAVNVVSIRAWVYGNPAVNYRTTTGLARRRETNITIPVTTFTQGATPLGAKPIGAEYFLNASNLYFRAGFVTGGVVRAIGYISYSPDGARYADYITDTDDAFAVREAAATNIDYTGTDPTAIPLGNGYFHLPNGKLFYNGSPIKDNQGNVLGNVASVNAWSPGGRWAAIGLIKDC